MVKNVVDVVFGGISYWMFGYGLSFGQDNAGGFCGWGDFFMDRDSSSPDMGRSFATFVFQLSFATTATTIVSGAMAERAKLDSYIVFSFINTVVYCIPAHWVWDSRGFLRRLGCVDIAGSGAVHFLGAVSALVAAYMLGPRLGKYDSEREFPRGGNPTNAMIGMFMLWWGWLAFNCGSTFGISNGKWKLAANPMYPPPHCRCFRAVNSKQPTQMVSISAGCSVVRPWEAVVIGFIGGLIVVPVVPIMDKLKIDDPVGAFPVHGLGGLWGMLACGIFVDQDPLDGMNNGQKGLLHGGGFHLLGVQLLTCVCIAFWSAIVTVLSLGLLKLTMGIRMTIEEELLGADLFEHNIGTVDQDCLMEEKRYFSSRVRPRRYSGLVVKAMKKRGLCGCSPDEESGVVGGVGGAGSGGDVAHNVNEIQDGGFERHDAAVAMGNGATNKLAQLSAYQLYGMTCLSGGGSLNRSYGPDDDMPVPDLHSTRPAQDLHKTCTRPAQDLHTDLHKTCTRPAQDLHKTCTRPAQDLLHKTCTRPAQDLHKTCTRPAQDLHKTCHPSTCEPGLMGPMVIATCNY
uniref:Ammonium transporter n=1 Tax=Macrostomum lignano TaxID=282301 RepID=A0A1I8IRJ7_9PLAT